MFKNRSHAIRKWTRLQKIVWSIYVSDMIDKTNLVTCNDQRHKKLYLRDVRRLRSACSFAVNLYNMISRNRTPLRSTTSVANTAADFR